MNRARAKELLPIIQAFAEGEPIEFRRRHEPGEWAYPWSELPTDEAVLMTFPCDDYEYRIKPKAREFVIAFDHNGRLVSANYSDMAAQTIRVREVLED